MPTDTARFRLSTCFVWGMRTLVPVGENRGSPALVAEHERERLGKDDLSQDSLPIGHKGVDVVAELSVVGHQKSIKVLKADAENRPIDARMTLGSKASTAGRITAGRQPKASMADDNHRLPVSLGFTSVVVARRVQWVSHLRRTPMA